MNPEVLVGHQPLGAVDDTSEEAPLEVLIQQGSRFLLNTIGAQIGSSIS